MFNEKMKVIDYAILYSPNVEELKKAVKDSLANGWQPSGGVSVTPNQKGAIVQFVQAMVKYAS